MAETPTKNSSGFSIDWLVKGSLTKIGDILDRLTGRGWKPSSSLATSELIERMKSLMDAEVRKNGDGRSYVPHNIKLKMQWDKFSTDSETALKKLENEFLIAAVDHINDKHYYTHAPLSIEVKPDYFTAGVKLYLGFEKLDGDDAEAEHNVTLDGLKAADLIPESIPEKRAGKLKISFQAGGKQIEREITLQEGKRLSVGRTKENDLAIDDASVSKAHASLLLNKDGKLVVADTGSTNGTFVRGERIAYGKAIEIANGDALMFGLINVRYKFEINKAPEPDPLPKTEAYQVGEFEFKSKSERPDGNASVNERGDRAADTSSGPGGNDFGLAADSPPPIRPEDRTAPPLEGGEISSAAARPTATLPDGRVSARSDVPNDAAPRPGPTEANVDIDKDRQDWEV